MVRATKRCYEQPKDALSEAKLLVREQYLLGPVMVRLYLLKIKNFFMKITMKQTKRNLKFINENLFKESNYIILPG